jgi:Acetyltransferase (GNAT) domain
MEPWYLDNCCQEGRWDAVFVEQAGKTVAAMPFFLKKKWHWRYVAMPPLCKFLGPYLLPEFRGIKHETGIYTELLNQLPPGLVAFEQDCNYHLTNWLPYYWKGYRQSTRYSYTLDLSRSETDLFAAIAKNYRNKIKRCELKLSLRHDLPLSVLHKLFKHTFERQKMEAPISFSRLEALYDTLCEQHRCALFFAEDKETGDLHEAALLIWDKHAAYYLLSGSDSSLRAFGAGIWLQWQAILFVKNHLGLPVFDFEGSMMPNIEPGRRDFGATQRPYFRIQQEWSLLWKLGKWLWR